MTTKPMTKDYEYNREKFSLERTGSTSMVVRDDLNEIAISIEERGPRSVFVISSGPDDPGVWSYDLNQGLDIACDMLINMRGDESSPSEQIAKLWGE